ncbi:hypothetical protein GCM10010435_39730 [Winogradskya consettensis]|uniref:Uncharacterized protein n=2 Tax=Winogradskya TaxID=3240235 RepID=A0A919VU35_9ACTN|nr:hypothetical protein Ahu01nite_066120 [Actinoplanes humidus]GIM69568.1 hypothetical protein Aco04nite_15860 [Actinoplanes consettensis]
MGATPRITSRMGEARTDQKVRALCGTPERDGELLNPSSSRTCVTTYRPMRAILFKQRQAGNRI